MNIYIVSIFTWLFNSFLETSLIEKAQEKWILNIKLINPRDFCKDKKRQIDDEIYGWGNGLLIKAKPMIDAVNSIVDCLDWKFKIVYMAPWKTFLDQQKCLDYSQLENIIIVCWRYEWVDHRFEKYCEDNFPWDYAKMSIWKYVLMWWELPAMVFAESVTRLVDGVINENWSWEDESYNIEKSMNNIEYPQYTRPKDVYGYKVPEVLLSWHHKNIIKWRSENEGVL